MSRDHFDSEVHVYFVVQYCGLNPFAVVVHLENLKFVHFEKPYSYVSVHLNLVWHGTNNLVGLVFMSHYPLQLYPLFLIWH